MSMDLKEALERAEAVRRYYDAMGAVVAHAAIAEALGVVLAAARENHAAALVAKVSETTARVLEMTRSHPFRARGLSCYTCGTPESDPIHCPVTP